MARLTKRETKERLSLYELSYEYLRTNFSKFKDSTKLRVAIAMLQIFEKDDSKTKPEFHTHFTVILDGTEGSKSSANPEAERGVSTLN